MISELQERLVAELRPVARAASPPRALALWLACSALAVAAATLAVGPLRPGALQALVAVPRFALDCALGALAAGAGMLAALRLSTPGADPRGAALRAALVAQGLWIALHLWGLVDPALPAAAPAVARSCASDVPLYALAPMGLALLLLRRRAALERFPAAFAAALASAALPALAMQLGCVYEPQHALALHLAPALAFAAVGGAVGSRLLPRL